ncbi:ExbD/TolR family protein [Marinobacter sp.]|uniref:ExbD/TolR family protein n=1 Tax=Marinobacter sp. TaxID=50741 RepID=UPI00384D27F7
MKASAKARRLARHHKRGKKTGALNLVSLMDIFTILVFFLMVNSSSDVQILNPKSGIELPVSSAEKAPEDVLALTVLSDDILVNGRSVMKVDALQSFGGDVEPALKAELDYQANRSASPAPEAGRAITILADRELPYELLKKIMSTCVEAGYGAISLAVSQDAKAGAGA